MHDAFLSYARLDGRRFAVRLVDALARRQKSVWLDQDALLPGVDFSPELMGAIDAADAFLIVVTERSMSADSVCRKELEYAASRGKRIMPVVPAAWGAVPLPASTPASIRQLNFVFVSDGESFEHDIDTVVTGLDLDLPWVREHTRLLLRATEWASHDRRPDWLLRGDDLTGAEAWIGKVPSRPQPTARLPAEAFGDNGGSSPIELHRDLIAASRAFRDAEHESRVAERFGALARATIDRNPIATPLAARLALESVSRVPSPLAYGILTDCLRLMPSPQARIAHTGAVTVVAAGPSNLVASCNAGGLVRLSDFTSGSLHWEQNHGSEITCAEFSADGRRLVVGDVAGHVAVHDVASGTALASFEHKERVSSTSLSPAGRFALTTVGLGVGPWARGASVVRICDVETAEVLAEIPHDALANALFHPAVLMAEDTPIVVSTAHQGQFRLFDVHGKQLGDGPAGDGPEDMPCHMAVDPVRPRVAIVGMAGTLRVLDLASGSAAATIDVGTNTGAVAFGRGGRYLAAIAGDGTVLVWEVDGWTVVARVPAANACGMAFGGDEETLAVFGYDGEARIWQLAPLREVSRCSRVRPMRFASLLAGPMAVLAHDEQRCAWTVTWAGEPTWRPHDSGTPHTLSVNPTSGDVAVGGERRDPATQWASAARPRPGFIGGANASLDEVVTLETPRMIHLVAFRAERPGEIACVDGESVMLCSLAGRATERHALPGGIVKAAISRDGMHAVASDGQGGCWYWSGRAPAPQLMLCEERIASVAVSDDGGSVAGRTRDGGAVVVWDVQNERPRVRIALDGADHGGRYGSTLALSRDGRSVAAAVDKRVETIDVASGRLLGRITHQWPPIRVMFDVSAAFVISASASALGDAAAAGDLRVWQPATGRQLIEATLDSPATALATTFDGAVLASGLQSGDIALWDLANGAAIGRLVQPGEARVLLINGLAFSPDARWLYSLSGSLVRRHLWRPAELIAEVTRRMTDEPSTEKWAQAAGSEPRRAPSPVW